MTRASGRPKVRRAKIEDAAGMAWVHVETWRTAYAGIMPDAYLAGISHKKSERFFHKSLAEPEPGSLALVAEDANGSIVGFAVAGPDRDEDGGGKAELYGVYILERHQRQGLGRRLVAAVAQRLLRRGFRSMRVWVLSRNASRGFYERLGGKLDQRKFLKIGGAKLLAVRYAWRDLRALARRAKSAAPRRRQRQKA